MISHLIADRWSLDLLAEELDQVYSTLSIGSRLSLPLTGLPYSAFAEQQQSIWQFIRNGDLFYWLKQWGQAEASQITYASLPFASSAVPSLLSVTGEDLGHARITLTEKEAKGIKAYVLSENLTLFMLAVAGFASVLHTLSMKRSRVVFACTLANRTLQGYETTVGWFAQTHVLCLDLRKRMSVSDLLREVRSVVLGAQRHQRMPPDLLWHLVRRRPLPSDAVVSVEYLKLSAETRWRRWGDVSIRNLPILPPLARGLTFVISERAEGIDLAFRFAREHFNATDVTNLLEMIRQFMTTAAGI